MVNADTLELAKFTAMAEDWWDPNGSCKPLHQLNPLRLAFIQQQTEIHGKSIVDVGCGGGILSEGLARLGAQVTGIDLAEEVIEVAIKHAQNNQLTINYQYQDVETLAARQPQSFDVVTCMEMLEHVPDPTAIIQACAQLVKPGGLIFFSTLNRTLKAYALAIVGAEYLLQMLPKGTHEYAKFIRPSELDAAARAYHLQLITMTGISYNPFTQAFRLCADVSVNYLCCYRNMSLD